MNKKIVNIGWGILIVITLIAVFAPWLAPYNPYTDMDIIYLKPSREHLLGTNDIGQDIFSELLYGARTSLVIGFISAAISIIIITIKIPQPMFTIFLFIFLHLQPWVYSVI